MKTVVAPRPADLRDRGYLPGKQKGPENPSQARLISPANLNLQYFTM